MIVSPVVSSHCLAHVSARHARTHTMGQTSGTSAERHAHAPWRASAPRSAEGGEDTTKTPSGNDNRKGVMPHDEQPK